MRHETKTEPKHLYKDKPPGYFKHWGSKSVVIEVRWTYRSALSQLIRGHHLDIEVFGLRLASGLDEPLQHLKAEKDRTRSRLFYLPKLNLGFVRATIKSKQ